MAEMQLRTHLAQDFDEAALPALHIHQGDGLALPWHGYQGVDLFLANPPYLAAKNTDLSGYHSARQRGQTDSYLLFVSLALQVVRPDGWLALVLPDPVLARENATRERQRLLSETTIHHLWHLSGVFSAHVGAVVLIAQKRPPAHLHQIPWIRGHWLTLEKKAGRPAKAAPNKPVRARTVLAAYEEIPLKKTSQALLLNQSGSAFCYLLGEVQNSLIQHLRDHLSSQSQETLMPLGELVQIRRGEELSKETPLLLDRRPEAATQNWYPVLKGGGEVRPYVLPEGKYWLAHEHIDKPLERYLLPKLIVVKSTGRLQATLDLRGHVVLQTLYLLRLPLPHSLTSQPGEQPEEEAGIDFLYFLLALLNSRLLREYVYVLHTAYKWVQPQIEQHVLANLPIPNVEFAARAAIIERAKQLYACSSSTPIVELEQRWNALYEEQELAICALYTLALSVACVPSSS
jgi:hypothetical protein